MVGPLYSVLMRRQTLEQLPYTVSVCIIHIYNYMYISVSQLLEHK